MGLECAWHWVFSLGPAGCPCAKRSFSSRTTAYARRPAGRCALGWSWWFWIHAEAWYSLDAVGLRQMQIVFFEDGSGVGSKSPSLSSGRQLHSCDRIS